MVMKDVIRVSVYGSK